MNVSTAKITFTGTIGVIGAAITSFFGGWSNDLITLIIFMAIDFVTGLIVAGVFHQSKKTGGGGVESNACFKGLIKKCAILLMVGMCARIDITLGIDYIRTAAVIGFIVNETLSIVENMGLMGIPLPKAITKGLELLKSKADGGGKNA